MGLGRVAVMGSSSRLVLDVLSLSVKPDLPDTIHRASHRSTQFFVHDLQCKGR